MGHFSHLLYIRTLGWRCIKKWEQNNTLCAQFYSSVPERRWIVLHFNELSIFGEKKGQADVITGNVNAYLHISAQAQCSQSGLFSSLNERPIKFHDEFIFGNKIDQGKATLILRKNCCKTMTNPIKASMLRPNLHRLNVQFGFCFLPIKMSIYLFRSICSRSDFTSGRISGKRMCISAEIGRPTKN